MLTRQLILTLTTVSLIWIAPHSKAEEFEFANADSALRFFANFALLVDRGIAVTHFAPTADEYVVDRILTSESFRRELGISPEVMERIKKEVQQPAVTHREFDRKAAPSVGITCVQFDFSNRLAARSALQSHLTEPQQSKLAELYLNIEGLLALRRPWFSRNLEIPEELQRKIADLARDQFIEYHEPNVDKVGSHQLHLAKFALRKDEIEELPIVTSNLRRMSAELDREIVGLLSIKQKELLAEKVEHSSNNMRDVHLYTLGAPNCMLGPPK
jgi:hypothetical protein